MTLEFWQDGIALWYEEDYLAAMSVWRDGLDEIAVEPLTLPWQSLSSSSSQKPIQGDRNYATITNGTHGSRFVTSLAPLYLFLAGCYLDAQDFDAAETCCRQGLQAIILHHAQHQSTKNQDKRIMMRLVQELMSCWQENPTVTTHCQQARLLLEWLRNEYPALLDSCWSDSWQRPAFVYTGLLPCRQAVCPRSQHPEWCRLLEQEFDWIQKECQAHYHTVSWQALPAVGQGHHRQGAGAHDGSVVNSTGDWREAVLLGAGESPRVAPQTRQWLQQHCPDAVSLARQGGGEVIVSVLAPHTHIAPHCASTNLRWTAHLGLRIPPKGRVQIRIADDWHSWQEGQVLVFDDSYEHEVVNDSDEIRVVLLLRFWNPHLAVADRRAALQRALDWKEQEQERRFHPPPPPLT